MFKQRLPLWILITLLSAGTPVVATDCEVPVYADGFECGTARWSSAVGEDSPLPGPPIGLYAPELLCSWTGPPPGDPFPSHVEVIPTPLAADLPIGPPGSVEIVAVTYNGIDGGSAAGAGTDPSKFGVLRILDGATCEQLATVSDPSRPIIGAAHPAIGDLDGDGTLEIVALRAVSGLVAFRWNSLDSKYETFWEAEESEVVGMLRWDGPMLHDLDDDGNPEVISAGEVFSGTTGLRINSGQALSPPNPVPMLVAADIDVDGKVELVANTVFEWDTAQDLWVADATGNNAWANTAVADFGTPLPGPDFDPDQADGVAELVSLGGALPGVRLGTVDGNFLIDAASGRGAPAVADFDGDDQPEIAAPDGFVISLFDLDCPTAGPGCEGDFVRWSSPIQDASSGRSMASAFDFEADGRDEVVFADECFARIYDGLSGEILGSSPRSSCTFAEGVSIADTNRDGAAELLVGSNSNCSVPCPAIDPVHAGLRCQDSSDCLSGSCVAGLCRCADSGQCQADYACSPPLEGTDGNTCRAAHPGGSIQGVRVLRDAEARWGATLDIWNQHSYTVTNVDSCGGIPATSDWIPNHTDPRRNDHRTADSICRP